MLVNIFEPLPHDLKLVLHVILGLLDVSEALLGLEVFADLGLQVGYFLGQLRVPLYVVSVLLLEDVVLALNRLEFCEWHGETQLGEEEFKLLDGLSLPFLEGVDALLDEAILLAKVGLTVVVLSAE